MMKLNFGLRAEGRKALAQLGLCVRERKSERERACVYVCVHGRKRYTCIRGQQQQQHHQVTNNRAQSEAKPGQRTHAHRLAHTTSKLADGTGITTPTPTHLVSAETLVGPARLLKVILAVLDLLQQHLVLSVHALQHGSQLLNARVQRARFVISARTA